MQVPARVRIGVIGIVDLVVVVAAHHNCYFEGPFGFVLEQACELPFVACSIRSFGNDPSNRLPQSGCRNRRAFRRAVLSSHLAATLRDSYRGTKAAQQHISFAGICGVHCVSLLGDMAEVTGASQNAAVYATKEVALAFPDSVNISRSKRSV